MRTLITAALLLAALLPAQEEVPAIDEAAPQPATHQKAAAQLIELLEETEACLAGCTDAAGVQAALPRLHDLAYRAREFKEMQDHLPEPTTQDYIAAQELLGRFNTIWQAIRDHIERLKKENLLTPELRSVLVIEPEQQQ